MSAAQYGPMFRDVSVRISGDFVRDVPTWILPLVGAIIYATADSGKNANGIKALLNNRGWIVESVADQSGWFTGDDIFQVDAVVAKNYSDAEIQAQMRRDLADLFIVTGISMVTPPYTVPTGTTPTINNPPPANYTPPPGGAQTPGGNNPNLPTLPTSSLDAFASSLGVSAPIAIVGGLILVVLLTRR